MSNSTEKANTQTSVPIRIRADLHALLKVRAAEWRMSIMDFVTPTLTKLATTKEKPPAPGK